MIDPFTQVSQAILSALQSDAGWSALVKPGNVIDMTSATFERFRTQLQPGDVPEVILLQTDFKLSPFGPASRSAEIEQTFQMITTHGSLRVRPVNQLKFQTLISLSKAGPSLGLDGLVRDWQIINAADDTEGHKQWRRGTQRWVNVLSIKVNMFMSRDRLGSL